MLNHAAQAPGAPPLLKVRMAGALARVAACAGNADALRQADAVLALLAALAQGTAGAGDEGSALQVLAALQAARSAHALFLPASLFTRARLAWPPAQASSSNNLSRNSWLPCTAFMRSIVHGVLGRTYAKRAGACAWVRTQAAGSASAGCGGARPGSVRRRRRRGGRRARQRREHRAAAGGATRRGGGGGRVGVGARAAPGARRRRDRGQRGAVPGRGRAGAWRAGHAPRCGRGRAACGCAALTHRGQSTARPWVSSGHAYVVILRTPGTHRHLRCQHVAMHCPQTWAAADRQTPHA